MRARALLFATSLIAQACTVTTALQHDPEPKPNASGDARPSAPGPGAAPVEREPTRAPPSVAEDQLLDCPAPGVTKRTIYCTESGKVAGGWVIVDSMQLPDDATIIFDVAGPDATRQTRLQIAVRGEELYITHVTCGACRRVLGRGFTAYLTHMREDQLRAMQTQLGLDAALPVLTDAAAWTTFCADERGKQALTRIAALSESEAGDARGR